MERDQTLVQQIAIVTKDQTNTFHGALVLHQVSMATTAAP